MGDSNGHWRSVSIRRHDSCAVGGIFGTSCFVVASRSCATSAISLATKEWLGSQWNSNSTRMLVCIPPATMGHIAFQDNATSNATLAHADSSTGGDDGGFEVLQHSQLGKRLCPNRTNSAIVECRSLLVESHTLMITSKRSIRATGTGRRLSLGDCCDLDINSCQTVFQLSRPLGPATDWQGGRPLPFGYRRPAFDGMTGVLLGHFRRFLRSCPVRTGIVTTGLVLKHRPRSARRTR